MDLGTRVLAGDERTAARLISMIEEGKPEAFDALAVIYPHIGKAHCIGITGIPGAGKSTLIDRLAVAYAAKGRTVGVLAVDPTSPLGGGALLGDRIRMREAEKLPGIFIRSMAHRGHPGGIAGATLGAAFVLEALGKETILIESVGAGQTEMEITSACDTTVTLLTPDFGDEIQLMKAGLIEIGDVIAVNKMDRPQAGEAYEDIRRFIGTRRVDEWQVPVVPLTASRGEGIEKLVEILADHLAYLDGESRKTSRKREKSVGFVMALLKERAWSRLLDRWSSDERFKGLMDRLLEGSLDPYRTVSLALDMMKPEGTPP
jgi:LAO/AO transport system kinase